MKRTKPEGVSVLKAKDGGSVSLPGSGGNIDGGKSIEPSFAPWPMHDAVIFGGFQAVEDLVPPCEACGMTVGAEIVGSTSDKIW